MIETYKKYICSNCKGICDKGIVIIKINGTIQAKCVDYEKAHDVEGHKREARRTAKQIKPLMRFTQEY